VTSTDFLRQTMRAIIPSAAAPALHRSSFAAASAVASTAAVHDATVAGFVEQSLHVRTAVDAVLSRAHDERLSMVLEGVHVMPEPLPLTDDAVVVSCVVTIRSPTDHAQRFHHRDREGLGRRPAHRYLAAFNEIRQIDAYLRRAADAAGVPVVENDDLDATIDRVIDLVLNEVRRIAPAAEHAVLAVAG
jgi:2-phosphoglycerate kinase